MKTLILGGVRSGKSRLAESLALRSAKAVTYIATATANDEEMRRRIETHRVRRAADWALVEEPLQLANALQTNAQPDRCIIVDCLTLWLTNLLMSPNIDLLTRERTALLTALPKLNGDIIFVGNETGLGIMPLGELTRHFIDEAGTLHQELAQQCDHVVFTIAGLPTVLKGDFL